MNKLLTIVIPAYNMEALLPRCLDSICTEKVMDKVQVIVVNDGSKDRTLEIARSYESRYPQYITVIDKNNGNYGSCMNMGLSIAKGKYFRTLDADDWYKTEAYEKFVDELEHTEADMLINDRFIFYEKSNELTHETMEMSPELLNKDIPIDNRFWKKPEIIKLTHVQCICYKTEILKLTKMKWSENVFYTDLEFLYWPLSSVRTIRFIPLPVYIYLIGREEQSVNVKSIMKNFHSSYVVSKKIAQDFVLNSKPYSNVYDLQKKYVCVILGYYFYPSLLYNSFNKEAMDEVDDIVKQNEQLNFIMVNQCVWMKQHYLWAYRKCKPYFLIICKLYKLYNKLFNQV